MAVGNTSLRFQVEKLVGGTRGTSARVRLLERARVGGTCRVCVQIEWTGGSVALYFFRHIDGVWRPFPPERQRLAMGTALQAA